MAERIKTSEDLKIFYERFGEIIIDVVACWFRLAAAEEVNPESVQHAAGNLIKLVLEVKEHIEEHGSLTGLEVHLGYESHKVDSPLKDLVVRAHSKPLINL